MNIKICSRIDIEKISSKPFDTDTALISIRDTNDKFPDLMYKPEWVLGIVFDDISSEEIDDYAGNNYWLFDESAADTIAKFVLLHEKKIETLICQCEHGQSRSAAVAAALREFYNKDGISIFSDDRYYPNKLVFRLTLKSLNCQNISEKMFNKYKICAIINQNQDKDVFL